MSGHSKWASIKHKKGAVDAKRGKIFTKIIKEITVAARLGGGDLTGNSRLRQAIASAKQANMPADNITRAIKKGTGELEGVQYEEVTYEGYGPGGAAVFVEVMTDKKNRTVGEIRSIFTKNNGNIGANGCVAWMFEQKGFILIDDSEGNEDELMELAIEAGAEDLKREGDQFQITTSLEDFESVRKAFEDKEIKMAVAELTRISENSVELDKKNGKSHLRLLESLEDHDDVQKVYSNFDIPEDVMAAIESES